VGGCGTEREQAAVGWHSGAKRGGLEGPERAQGGGTDSKRGPRVRGHVRGRGRCLRGCNGKRESRWVGVAPRGSRQWQDGAQ